MNYGCGQSVMEGDTVERVGESLSLTVGDWYTVYIPSMSYGNIGVKEIVGTMNYCPSFLN